MSDAIPELETFIDYRLKQLAERNEHHKFEDIATRIARKRISANILVANGPVSAGGDQQRDSESYTTRIPDELPHSAGFSASASTSPVVVACTIQREGLKAKVLSDLAGICAEGAAPVDLVTFFSVHSIPEAASHELQRVAREKYGVTLNVLSGMKVATILAEPDLVWVAQHYLELPSSMVPAPEVDATPGWYRKLLENLRRNRGPAALTPAALGEVSEGLRFATWDKDANADLPEWLEFAAAFLTDNNAGADGELVFRACYEMSVARFRGIGVAAGVEDLIRRAISFACSSDHPNILEDAATLVSYWGAMWSVGVAQTDVSEIAAAGERLRAHAVSELGATDVSSYPVRAASLTGTLALLHLQPRWGKVAEEHGLPQPATIAPYVGVKLEELDFDTSHLAADDSVDIAGAMSYLDQLVDLLPKARPYSVRSLSKVFTMFVPALSAHPSYLKVRDGLDAAISAVEGDGAIAGKCRNRGVAFVDAGKLLEALAELHNAKLRWFHGDSMFGSVLTMRYIGNLYRDLGLTYAAKMYSCSAAVMANQSSDDAVKAHVPKALFEAASAAQDTGCWVDAAQLTEVALLAHNSFSTDPFDLDKHPELERHQLNELMELVAVRAFWPEVEPLFKAAHPRTGWYEHLSEQASEIGNSMSLEEEEFQSLACKQFSGPILADLGAQRTIDFCALGARWVFTFANNRATVLTAEGFCAGFQILLADIARLDPVIIGATVQASIEVAAGAGHDVDDVDIDDSGPEIKARITLSDDTSSFDEISWTLVATGFQLLGSVHVRPTDELYALLEQLMRDGISHKIMVARPYQESADLMPEEHYARCAAAERPSSSDGFEPVENEHLAASTTDGPGYDREGALQLIRERYEVADEAWKLSIASILADDRGKAAVAALREDGWLDWQILVAIVNIGLNWRMQKQGITPQTVSLQELRQVGIRAEAPNEPRLPIELVLDQLDFGMRIQTAAVAQSWKVLGRNETPDEGALRDLLVRRYHYSEDDIPHRDLLNCLDHSGNLLPLLHTAPGN